MMTAGQHDTEIDRAFEAMRERIRAAIWVEHGWRQIVIDAARKIEWLEMQNPGNRIEWLEIKEWNGTLAMRYRTHDADLDENVLGIVEDVVMAAKVRADRTCVVCGGRSDGAFEYKGDTLRVYCKQHRAAA